MGLRILSVRILLCILFISNFQYSYAGNTYPTPAELGSQTAKGGFANEKTVCKKFNDWRNDREARQWLKIMGYDLEKIESVEAINIPTRIKKSDLKKFGLNEDEDFEDLRRFGKADVRVIIKTGGVIKTENLSLKKANSDADFNQVDKRWVDFYQKMWGFDNEIALGLKLFTGEINHASHPEVVGNKVMRDKKRIFMDELPDNQRNRIIEFLTKNKTMIVSDILKGRGGLAVRWLLDTCFNKADNTTTWILKDIDTAIDFFGSGEVKVSPRGSLYIGKITMMRKGGTPDPEKLQFKIKPCELFDAGT
ncbi:MAG: hypothetical protein HY754_02845 [Nitrospirae bacterium]|nr:hypothetical protein [Nitrospirota bacterium]